MPTVQLTVHVIPRSSKPAVAGVRDGALLVRLQSAPVEGAANNELTELMAKTFGVARRDVTILSGERSRRKRIAIPTDRRAFDSVLHSLGIDPQELNATL